MTTSQKAILHVIGSAGFGGGERYLLDLVRFSSDQYRHVAAIPHTGPLSREMDSAGNTCRIIDMPRIPSISSIIRLYRLSRQEKADIIHSHGFRANLYGRLVAILCRKPHVATIHVSLYDYLETPPPVRRLYQWIESRSSGITRCFICVSEAMAGDMRRLGIREDRIIVVENGVDPIRFMGERDRVRLRSKFEIQDRHPVIGTVGRLVPEKNHVSLIRALSGLKADFPDLACLIVGQGPLLQSLQQSAREEGVSGMCRFIGSVEEIEDVYAVLDLFVLPSLREPFGLAVLEAMASRTAVLATDAGGPSEYIRNNVNGMLVPPGEPTAMAAEIRGILSDRPLRKALAEEGRRTVVERFDIRKTVERIETVYSSL